MKRLNIIEIALLLLFVSCTPEYVLHNNGNDLFLTEIKGNPYLAEVSRLITTKNTDEEFRYFKMTKGVEYIAVGINKIGGRMRNWDTKLIIKGPKIDGRSGNGDITRVITREEINRLIGYHPGTLVIPMFMGMEWTTNNTLIVLFTPESTSELVPVNVSLEIEIVERIRLIRKEFSPRGRFTISPPIHPFKNRHDHFQENGKLFIRGEEVEGLPPISKYDIIFN